MSEQFIQQTLLVARRIAYTRGILFVCSKETTVTSNLMKILWKLTYKICIQRFESCYCTPLTECSRSRRLRSGCWWRQDYVWLYLAMISLRLLLSVINLNTAQGIFHLKLFETLTVSSFSDRSVTLWNKERLFKSTAKMYLVIYSLPLVCLAKCLNSSCPLENN